MQHMTNQPLKLRIWSVLGLSALLVACAAPPPRRTVVASDPVPARIMVYPAQGQSPDQLERDRYECHVWAVQQTGFDPSRPGLPPGQRVVVEPANPDELARTIRLASVSGDSARAERAATIAQRYNFADAMASYSELIQQLLHETQ